MKGLEFPIVGTKVKGLSRRFDLANRDERTKYFDAKVGDEIRHLKKFMDKNTFLAFWVGKKGSGKGTYSKMFEEVFGSDRVVQISVGDLVRDYHAKWKDFEGSEKYRHLKAIYRGFIPFDEAVSSLEGRSVSKLLPTEFILALLKLEIEGLKGKSILLDGLPRDLDQVSYSLFFRDLANYRDDPDMFWLVDIPMEVIEARIRNRVVCPKCKTSRNMKFDVVKNVGYDKAKKEFFLVCDSPECNKVRMSVKESDSLGLEPIRDRLGKDEDVLKAIWGLHGIPKLTVRNYVPIDKAGEFFDDYEITPETVFSRDGEMVKVDKKAWVIHDDGGKESYSLLPPVAIVSLLKQLPESLGL